MNPTGLSARSEDDELWSLERLRELSTREGIDAATTHLYRAVLDSPRNAPFINRVRSFGGEPTSSPPPADVTLVVVPGAFYREYPRTGADGRVVREQAERLGWRTELIPIASLGSLDENARIIRDWLTERRESRIVLVSLSKGGSDVKRAMSLPGADRAFERVAGWLNLCGILDGTPMADWLLSLHPSAVLIRLYHRLRGRRLDLVGDLRRTPSSPLSAGLRLPDHIRMISVVGFPLQSQLSNATARRCHRRLRPYGPNDGCLILADVCALPGFIYPIWGADHYLKSGVDLNALIAAMLRFMGEELAACRLQPLNSLAQG
jgi:hypothetical protein